MGDLRLERELVNAAGANGVAGSAAGQPRPAADDRSELSAVAFGIAGFSTSDSVPASPKLFAAQESKCVEPAAGKRFSQRRRAYPSHCRLSKAPS